MEQFGLPFHAFELPFAGMFFRRKGRLRIGRQCWPRIKFRGGGLAGDKLFFKHCEAADEQTEPALYAVRLFPVRFALERGEGGGALREAAQVREGVRKNAKAA